MVARLRFSRCLHHGGELLAGFRCGDWLIRVTEVSGEEDRISLELASYARIPNAVNAIRAGNLLFLSGCSAVDPDGNVVGLGDVEKQTRQAMENMKAALDVAGATFKNVVHMDTFYADPRLTQQTIHVRSSYFSSENPYTTTGAQVTGFGKPGMFVEMDAIAVLDDDHE